MLANVMYLTNLSLVTYASHQSNKNLKTSITVNFHAYYFTPPKRSTFKVVLNINYYGMK